MDPELGGAPSSSPRASTAVEFPAASLRDVHVLYLVNVDWFFLSHRLPLAVAAVAAGARVTVAAADTGRGDEIRRHGLDFVPLALTRAGRHPLAELTSLLRIAGLYRRLDPDLIHQVTVKPVLYGSLVARALRPRTAVVNAISGLGFTFTDETRERWLLAAVSRLYRFALAHPRSRTIFQNADDLQEFIRRGLVRPSRAVIIRGSGVDCDVFAPTPPTPGAPLVVLPSRMLWDKGVGEFVDAARQVRARMPDVRFALVGAPDRGNPTAVAEVDLRQWVREGVVEWWGHREDMVSVLGMAAVVVLPTYREGLPKVLLEAAAVGRPIVTTDVPGCREVVQHGRNGLLVPARDAVALGDAVETLLADPDMCAEFGEEGRRRAESEFSLPAVVEETLALYRSMLAAEDG